MEGREQPSLWNQYVALDSRLAGLLEIAQDGGDERDWAYIKRSFLPLVGWEAERSQPAELRTDTAYNAAYSVLRRAFEIANERAGARRSA